MSVAVPVFVSVSACVFVCPSTTLPKLKVDGVTLKPACTPVPLKLIVNGDPLALLVTVTVPVALPTAVGVNFAVKLRVWEAATVAGVLTPVKLNPVPLTAMLETVAAAFPVFVRVICWVALLLVETLPKFTLAGLALNCPTAVDDPVPAKVTTAVGVVGSLLVIVRLPDTAPASVGLNVKVTGAFCPALMVLGVVMPLIPKSAPESVRSEIVKSAVPAFEMVRIELPVEPTETLPKFTALALKLTCGCGVTPVAERFTTTGELPPSPCTVNVPVIAPALVGLTETEKLPPCPVASAIGGVIPERLNWEFEKVA